MVRGGEGAAETQVSVRGRELEGAVCDTLFRDRNAETLFGRASFAQDKHGDTDVGDDRFRVQLGEVIVNRAIVVGDHELKVVGVRRRQALCRHVLETVLHEATDDDRGGDLEALVVGLPLIDRGGGGNGSVMAWGKR